VRLDHDRCTISADASGDLLHRRGYRLAVARAPLRESLAAAMLAGAPWDPRTPLVDPMCGAGTIPIEAALMARRIAPGLRRAFAAERWPIIDRAEFAKARAAAADRALPAATAAIIGSDRDAGAIEAAQANAERAGVARDITFRQHALSALQGPDEAGLLLTNPPYGVRVGEKEPLRDLFARLGQVARTALPGWRVAMLSADRDLEAQVGLPFEERFRTSNGGIAVRLVTSRS
jgi:putative N6-adenine-specific DNA methylase